MSDQAWMRKNIRAALRGDSAAYGELIRRHQSGLRGYIAMLGTPSHAVEDIAQDTFVVAYKKLAVFEHDRPFAAWLRGIALNLTREWCSKRERCVGAGSDRLMDHLMTEEIRDAALQEEEDYATSHLRQCLEKLPERSRKMVDLKYTARKACTEIAAELGLETAAVQMGLCRIRLRLRDCIDKLAAVEGAA